MQTSFFQIAAVLSQYCFNNPHSFEMLCFYLLNSYLYLGVIVNLLSFSTSLSICTIKIAYLTFLFWKISNVQKIIENSTVSLHIPKTQLQQLSSFCLSCLLFLLLVFPFCFGGFFFFLSFSRVVLVCSGCHNKLLETG